MTLISNFGVGKITVLRQEPGHYNAGTWIKGDQKSFECEASVQPASPREMQLLPESRRVSGEAKRFYTDVELKVASTKAGINSDKVVYQGECYEILSVDKWLGDLPHFKSIGVRIEQEVKNASNC